MVGAAVKPTGSPTPAQKPRPAAPQREPGAPRKPGPPGPIIRIIISLWIVWHFTGVLLAAMCVPYSSPLVTNVSQKPPMQWYLDALYLNQGHSFFAPEVGPVHIIRYQLFDQSGRVMGDTKELPNTKDQWPRLFYHRHFMLAEQGDFPTDNKQTRDYWQRMYLEAYGRHLLRVNENAQSVRLQRLAHYPTPRDFAASGRSLKDPQGYELLIEVTQRRSDLGPPPGSQSLNWQDNRAEMARRWNGGPR